MPDERAHTVRFNARIPELTNRQIAALIAKLGLTKTQIVIIAVDRMARDELADDPPAESPEQ